MNEAKNVYLKVHPDIYESYLRLYDECRTMVDKMDAVLDDGEHALVMEEGAARGYSLPDLMVFRVQNAALRETLRDLNPHNVRSMGDGHVLLPAPVARGLYDVAAKSSAMVRDVLDVLTGTDYLRCFTDVKRLGFPYAGPTSLQEVFNVWGQNIRRDKSEKRHAPQRPMPRSWFNPRP